jgi:hypothetical protein
MDNVKTVLVLTLKQIQALNISPLITLSGVAEKDQTRLPQPN